MRKKITESKHFKIGPKKRAIRPFFGSKTPDRGMGYNPSTKALFAREVVHYVQTRGRQPQQEKRTLLLLPAQGQAPVKITQTLTVVRVLKGVFF